MTYKELFLKDEELKAQLAAVTHADWFLKCLAYAKAQLMDTAGINTDHLLGARQFEQILLSLADEEPDVAYPPTLMGLEHNLDKALNDLHKAKEKH